MSSTFMSMGSGSGVYDPVTTTDGFPQNGGEVRFMNDGDEGGWSGFKIKGGHTYSYGTYRKSGIKAFCDKISSRSRPRCLLIASISAICLVFLIIIIAVARSRTHTHTLPGNLWTKNPSGLNFYPAGIEDTDFFPFSPRDKNTYQGYIDGMVSALKDYDSSTLHNHARSLCNKTYTSSNVTCQQHVMEFGDRCIKSRQFGYFGGEPCILLTFDMPKEYTMRGLVPSDGEVYVRAEKVLGERFSSDDIGISCEPIPEDKDKVSSNMASKENVSDVIYSPSTGFPGYFFQKRTTDEFVPPAVMVQFNYILGSVKDARTVRFTCTAWGMMLNSHKDIVSPTGVFNATFAFRIQ